MKKSWWWYHFDLLQDDWYLYHQLLQVLTPDALPHQIFFQNLSPLAQNQNYYLA
jgi:hypothetical protein